MPQCTECSDGARAHLRSRVTRELEKSSCSLVSADGSQQRCSARADIRIFVSAQFESNLEEAEVCEPSSDLERQEKEGWIGIVGSFERLGQWLHNGSSHSEQRVLRRESREGLGITHE